ncbi:hypothetical protein HK100_009284 [Physocladia obscura]|uniref:FAD-binding domain-containing protein n=1 Tax=Physocladia obscura TaxID=109957 RepID=A0AAD5SMR8_9FUNG|nr:hypothetical protein HK100_009284 [Physocladia obscura]
MPLRVLVIGGGLVGATAGLALKKQGHEVTILDKLDAAAAIRSAAASGTAPSIHFGEVQGGSISLYTNGLLCLDRLGLLDAVLGQPHALMSDTGYMKMDGSDLITRLAAPPGKFAYPPRFFLRSFLHGVLMAQCNARGIKLYTSRKLVGLEQTPAEVVCRFDDGSSVAADLVLGCDGIHSAVRKAVFPDAAKPEFWRSGYIGVFERGQEVGPDKHKLDFRRATAGGIYSDAVSGELIYTANCNPTTGAWFVLKSDVEQPAAGAEVDDWRPTTDLPTESKNLARVVQEWGAPPDIVDTIAHAKRITPVNIYDLPDLPSFHSGRVLLLGDAAHGTMPIIGQGFCSGLEDVAVLSELFEKFNDPKDLGKVLTLYDKIRLPRVRAITKSSREVSARLKAPTPTSAAIGRVMMKLIFSIKTFLGAQDAIVTYDYRTDFAKVVAESS